MGSIWCCGDDGDDGLEDEKTITGPVHNRHCTDIPCLIVLALYIAFYFAMYIKVLSASNMEVMRHGHNFAGDPCQKMVYYPDLERDYRESKLIRKYGVCVDKCPDKGTVAEDDNPPEKQRQPKWFVPHSTTSILNRCIPYVEEEKKPGGELCAWPRCEGDKTSPVTRQQQVCGLEAEGTSKYWILGKPSEMYEDGWKAEGVNEKVIEARMNMDVEAHCDIKVSRNVTITIVSDSGVFTETLAQYTGIVFRQANLVYENQFWILGLGIGGAILISAMILLTFSKCVECAVWTMIALLFIAVLIVDYILFRKANINTGRSGAKVAALILGDKYQDITSRMLDEAEDPQLQTIYTICAVVWSILILALFCIAMYLKKNIRVLVALTEEAATTIRQMPSLLLFPFFGVLSMAAFCIFVAYTELAVMSLPSSELAAWGEMLQLKDPEGPKSLKRAREFLTVIVLFSFLWIYFFHVAVFTSITANAVTKWYFYRNDPNHAGFVRGTQGWFFGRPVLEALGTILRYHLGSLALGSFLLAVCSLPRIILAYLENEMKQANGSNPLLETIMRAAMCCLWCFEKCLKFLTKYAYINIAVSGKSFCRAARASYVLIATHPVQVGLDEFATNILDGLSCVLVPCVLVAIAYWALPLGWGISACFIVGLSFAVTRMMVGVYDICMSTLFVCVTRDQESFGGRYAPESLRIAMQLPPVAQATVVEMKETSGGLGATRDLQEDMLPSEEQG